MSYRCDTSAFLFDVLGHVLEQLELALNDPNDRLAGIDCARGTVPLIRDRLFNQETNEVVRTPFMLVADEFFTDHEKWSAEWKKLSKLDDEEFVKQAAELRERIVGIRRAFEC